ncbi:MAG: hypothetical protein KF788_13485 [Piscinibacter sp.]|nr:hypothetical protein [Piscinibacter sp.]
MPADRLLAPVLSLLVLAACGEAPEQSSVLGAAPPAIAVAPAPAAPAVPSPPAAPDAAASAPSGIFRATLAAASGGDIAFVIDGEATLQRDPSVPVRRYRLEGRQVLSVQWIRCTPTATPAERPLADAWLEIDERSRPARYTLHAGSLWDATVSGGCPGLPGSASVPMRVPGLLEASGTLDADGRASGRRVTGDLRWEWSFPVPL